MTLSPDQQNAFEDASAGSNILITGPGGTGKSHLLRLITESFEERRIPLGVCGATGAAAVNVGGTTLHSWCGVGLGDGSIRELVNRATNNVPAYNRIRRTDALAIDEISMVPATLFTKLNEVFKRVKDNELPFGGIQLILFGDFLQLPPVDGGFTFESPAWAASGIATHLLTHIFRQEDRTFASVLSKIRIGEIDDEVRSVILPRSKAVDEEPEVRPIVLTPKNDLARAINAREIAKLEGEEKVYVATDVGSDSGKKLLEKGTIPAELRLKLGTRVVCCVNYLPELGVMNGSAGVVTGLPSASEVYVTYDNGEQVLMTRYKKEVSQDGKVIASRTQIPLKHGFAISIHGSQGMTLDKVEAHLEDCFEYGQAYVAFSRVRTLEGLFLKSLRKESIKVHPKALEFYSKKVQEVAT